MTDQSNYPSHAFHSKYDDFNQTEYLVYFVAKGFCTALDVIVMYAVYNWLIIILLSHVLCHSEGRIHFLCESFEMK